MKASSTCQKQGGKVTTALDSSPGTSASGRIQPAAPGRAGRKHRARPPQAGGPSPGEPASWVGFRRRNQLSVLEWSPAAQGCHHSVQSLSCERPAARRIAQVCFRE